MNYVTFTVPGHGRVSAGYDPQPMLKSDGRGAPRCATVYAHGFDNEAFDAARVVGARCPCCQRALCLVYSRQSHDAGFAVYRWLDPEALSRLAPITVCGGVVVHVTDNAVWQLERSLW